MERGHPHRGSGLDAGRYSTWRRRVGGATPSDADAGGANQPIRHWQAMERDRHLTVRLTCGPDPSVQAEGRRKPTPVVHFVPSCPGCPPNSVRGSTTRGSKPRGCIHRTAPWTIYALAISIGRGYGFDLYRMGVPRPSGLSIPRTRTARPHPRHNLQADRKKRISPIITTQDAAINAAPEP